MRRKRRCSGSRIGGYDGEGGVVEADCHVFFMYGSHSQASLKGLKERKGFGWKMRGEAGIWSWNFELRWERNRI